MDAQEQHLLRHMRDRQDTATIINYPDSLDDYSCGDNIVGIADMDEEYFAVSRSSPTNAAFDAVIACIEDIIIDEEFQQLQQSFMEKYYLEFEDSDENKLSYTPIFNEYVDLLEKHLEQQVMERIPDFDMKTFIELLVHNKEEVPGDIFDMLLTFTDFIAFKEMFLEYKADKEGQGLDLSQGLVVTSMVPASSRQNASTESL